MLLTARIALALTLLLLAPGCARPAGVLFADADSLHVWPAPPDDPHIRFLGEIRGSADLRPARTGAQSLGEFLFGKEPAKGLVGPMGVCTDAADRVFVADPNAQTLHVLNLTTRRYDQWKPPDSAHPFVQPIAVACDRSGRVLVSDPGAGVVFAFAPDGRLTGVLGRDVLKRPCGLALQPASDRLFIADTGAHAVVVLDASGAQVARLGSRGRGDGQFNFPTYLAFGPDGRLYVSDSLNFRVQVFAPDLSFLFAIGAKGDRPGYFAQPKGVAVTPAGNVFVVDAHFEAVQAFDAQGQLLMAFGKEGNRPGEFWLPAGIWADPKNRLWVADSYNRRVQVFECLSPGAAP
jgi:DNA-binding beta-propeller fold protein YncE